MASHHHHADSHDDRLGGGRGRGRGRSYYYAPVDSASYDPRRSHLGDSSYYGDGQPYGEVGSRPGGDGRRDHDDRGRGDYPRVDDRDRSHSSREYRRSARDRSRSRSRSASPSDPGRAGTTNRSYRRTEQYDAERSESTRGPSGPASRDHGGSGKEDLEAARRARMARLRAENEEEEQAMAGETTATAGADTPRRSGVVDASALEGLDEEEQMRLMLGFDGFGSTKNTKVADNHQTSARGAAAKNKARKYRQYMNRKNGFNRPLDKMD